MFDKKNVLITGGSKGLGRALGHTFAQRGARVVLVARHGATLARTVDEVRKNGGEAYGIEADVGSARLFPAGRERDSLRGARRRRKPPCGPGGIRLTGGAGARVVGGGVVWPRESRVRGCALDPAASYVLRRRRHVRPVVGKHPRRAAVNQGQAVVIQVRQVLVEPAEET